MSFKSVRRLEPTVETRRKLYLTSGNQCAFSGCKEMIMNSDGDLLGEICHIEAALPGGQRFNPNQSNEDRRHFDNLMLMCFKHHKITDNEEKYTVSILKEMKIAHEAKFADAVNKLENSIQDLTEKQVIIYPETLKELRSTLGWEFMSDDELAVLVPDVIEAAEMLKLLVPDTRNLFSIMIKKSDEHNYTFSISEVIEVAGLSNDDFRKHFGILRKYDFISEQEVSDYGYESKLIELSSGWTLWTDIKKFVEAKKGQIKVESIISDLNFKLLD